MPLVTIACRRQFVTVTLLLACIGCTSSKFSEEELAAPIERKGEKPALNLQAEVNAISDRELGVVLYEESGAGQDVLHVPTIAFDAVVDDAGNEIGTQLIELQWQVVGEQTDAAEGLPPPGTLGVLARLRILRSAPPSLSLLSGTLGVIKGTPIHLRVPLADLGKAETLERMADFGIRADLSSTHIVHLEVVGEGEMTPTSAQVFSRDGSPKGHGGFSFGGGSRRSRWELKLDHPVATGDYVGIWLPGDGPQGKPGWIIELSSPEVEVAP